MEHIGLMKYTDVLMGSGFDDMYTLVEIEDADLKDLGFPRGHVLKLRKRLREYQLTQYQCAEEEAPMHGGVAGNYRRDVGQAAGSHYVVGQVPASAVMYMPTDQQKSAIERSWEHVQALGTYVVGGTLYRNFFKIMPEVVDLYPPEVRIKYREWTSDEATDESDVFDSPALRKLFSRFVNAVGCAVAGLHDDTKLVHMLLQLGHRHFLYRVEEAHFKSLGRAFKWTLAEILGSAYTEEVEEAWAMAYDFMTSIMIEGLRMSAAAASVHGVDSNAYTAATLIADAFHDGLGETGDADGGKADALQHVRNSDGPQAAAA